MFLSTKIANFIEQCIRAIVVMITNWLPVKVIRDDKGVPLPTLTNLIEKIISIVRNISFF